MFAAPREHLIIIIISLSSHLRSLHCLFLCALQDGSSRMLPVGRCPTRPLLLLLNLLVVRLAVQPPTSCTAASTSAAAAAKAAFCRSHCWHCGSS